MQVKKQQLELDMEQQTGSKSGKEYVKAVYCHSAYLTFMQSTYAKCWAVCITSWNQFYYEKYQHTDIILMAEIEDILKSLLRKMKEENEKNWLKTQHSRN